MLRIANVKLRLHDKKDKIKVIVLKKLNINEKDLLDYSIYKESIDARDKGDILLVYTVNIKLKNEEYIYENNKKILVKVNEIEEDVINVDLNKINKSPIIIGFGPAGMFAALTLAKKGLKPIVFERGEAMDERIKSVELFWKKNELNLESNVQFGEGGAGTFSDGKLTARSKDKHVQEVLREFVKNGANKDILYKSKPHIGTDVIRDVVRNIRREIESFGGVVNFNSKLNDVHIKDNKIDYIIVNKDKIEVDDLIIAIGHSARDTFEVLNDKNISLSLKEFAIGFRIEHNQELISMSQYGKDFKQLPPAEYKLTYKASNGRGVYTFCMCPGGYVVASQSEENTVVTNGMSYFKRDAINSNSAIVVQVKKEDFESDLPLAGMEFQRDLEKKAFVLGGSNYRAPVQTVSRFLSQNIKTDVRSSYSNKTTEANLRELLNDDIYLAMKEGLRNFNKKIKGFDTGMLTAIETRTSSPVRMNRNENYQSLTCNNLYPIGEGSGYSGGIVTSAIDGIRGANKVLEQYK